jgi:thymidylate synthase (FAD)
MRIIENDVTLIKQNLSIEGMLKHIEVIGREAYKSHENIKSDSYIKFVKFLIENKHNSVLEHGTIYLTTTEPSLLNKYVNNKYSKINVNKGIIYITTNYRVLIENNWLSDLDTYYSEPTEYHYLRVSIKFSTQIGISRELNRHRVNSITEESTRFCNYSKNKFNNEITFSLPHYLSNDIINRNINKFEIISDENLRNGILNEQMTYTWGIIDWWLWSIKCSELAYFKLIELGLKAQDARYLLPLGTKTDLVHTSFISDWKDFIKKRSGKDVHPDAKILADKINNIIENI